MEQVWLEVTIDTTGAGIEPVCAYLTALGVGGLVVEEAADFEQFADENKSCWDEVDQALKESRAGADRVICYLTDDEDGRARLEELKAGLPAFRARTEADCGSLAVRTRPLREEDWAHNWQKYYQAFPVGEQLYIVPEWERGKPVPEGRTPVYLNPGLIFGTGSHGTTRLCLEGLERFVVPGAPVLDLGCGSGILSIAALVLGAREAFACDIDEKCVDVAYENAALNGIGKDRYTVRWGDVLTDKELQAEFGGDYDMVVANIVADVIMGLSGKVRPFLKEGGLFLCSGIIDDRAEEVSAKLRAEGWTIVEQHDSEGWYSFLCR